MVRAQCVINLITNYCHINEARELKISLSNWNLNWKDLNYSVRHNNNQ